MEIGRGVHIGTATNTSNGFLQLPLFSHVLNKFPADSVRAAAVARAAERVQNMFLMFLKCPLARVVN